MICQRLMSGFSLALAAIFIAACSAGGSAQRSPGQTAPSATPSQTPTVIVTSPISQELSRSIRLPGELQAYQDTAIYARVPGFIEEIKVDRGTFVRQGQLLARLRAPELDTQRSEAEARVRGAQSQRVEAVARVNSIRAQRLEAEAKLASDDATYQRMKAASATPGVVAGNDLEVAQRTVEAARARIQLWNENEKAALAQVQAIEQSEKALREASRSAQNIEAYLNITAPFDGVIAERNAHKGSLVGPASGANALPMLRVQQVSRLRLVVSVPENEIAGIARGAKLNFTVPAFPGEAFTGTVQRLSHSLDARTRTMPVELDVVNLSGRLAPGMFPEITWPVHRPHASLFVPPSAVAVTTERTFVIRVREGVTEWVDVKRGASMNSKGTDLVEVFGELNASDQIAVRGTDELRAGTRVIPKPAAPAAK